MKFVRVKQRPDFNVNSSRRFAEVADTFERQCAPNDPAVCTARWFGLKSCSCALLDVTPCGARDYCMVTLSEIVSIGLLSEGL